MVLCSWGAGRRNQSLEKVKVQTGKAAQPSCIISPALCHGCMRVARSLSLWGVASWQRFRDSGWPRGTWGCDGSLWRCNLLGWYGFLCGPSPFDLAESDYVWAWRIHLLHKLPWKQRPLASLPRQTRETRLSSHLLPMMELLEINTLNTNTCYLCDLGQGVSFFFFFFLLPPLQPHPGPSFVDGRRQMIFEFPIAHLEQAYEIKSVSLTCIVSWKYFPTSCKTNLYTQSLNKLKVSNHYFELHFIESETIWEQTHYPHEIREDLVWLTVINCSGMGEPGWVPVWGWAISTDDTKKFSPA